MKCKLDSITVNTPGPEYDYGSGQFQENASIVDCIKFLGERKHPDWTSMVIVVTNPEAKS